MTTRTPAAQYLRMSSEHQQYSLDNQGATISRYAEANGYEIVQTYSDPARSGLVLKRRPGLRQLLEDVVSARAAYRAVLVYDVSRWGRFQDTDESAHYEFLCKAARIPVLYCAESFSNDGTLPSLIMKALKRTMAGEYSRELGVKVLAGQQRLARLGFKQGGFPGYGLRRFLVSSSGEPKQQLANGERKSIATDRVVLVPGPRDEVDVVREVFRMLTIDGLTVHGIAQRLSQQGIRYLTDSQWDYRAVHSILSHPKYCGCNVFGRTSSRLSTLTIKKPTSEWIRAPHAFEPVIDEEIFLHAQTILKDRTFNKTDTELLDSLRALLQSEGRLSLKIIKNSTVTPSPSTYRHRFGSLRHSYELIGYGRADQYGPIDLRQRTQAIREDVMGQVQAESDGRVTIARKGGRWRSYLKLSNGRTVSVLIARSIRANRLIWRVSPNLREWRRMTLLVLLNKENTHVYETRLFRSMSRMRVFHLRDTNPWFENGLKLNNFKHFCDLTRSLGQRFH